MASSNDVATKNDGANNDDMKKRETYKWTDETVLALCGILNKYLMSNGRSSQFKWNEHQSKFEKVAKTKENDKVKRIRKKQPSIELQETWYPLFGDAVATGVDVVGPSVNASDFNDTNHVNVEDEDTGAEMIYMLIFNALKTILPWLTWKIKMILFLQVY
ncbi:hypothetical protein Tco_1186935, partial [Tanacetum coccineum]